jgi:hypothetical protein
VLFLGTLETVYLDDHTMVKGDNHERIFRIVVWHLCADWRDLLGYGEVPGLVLALADSRIRRIQ